MALLAPASTVGGMPGALRWLFWAYFATHIPITLLIDAQGAFSNAHPPALKQLLAVGDFLMADPPRWFQSLVTVEVFAQLPFFFVACFGFWTAQNWLRLPCIIYGSHVATTLVPILDAFAHAPQLTAEQRTTLIAIYSPYLLIPLLLVAVMLHYEKPFGTAMPQGHPKGGDASKCPFAAMMGLNVSQRAGKSKAN